MKIGWVLPRTVGRVAVSLQSSVQKHRVRVPIRFSHLVDVHFGNPFSVLAKINRLRIAYERRPAMDGLRMLCDEPMSAMHLLPQYCDGIVNGSRGADVSGAFDKAPRV
jgi:hypothetical protein